MTTDKAKQIVDATLSAWHPEPHSIYRHKLTGEFKLTGFGVKADMIRVQRVRPHKEAAHGFTIDTRAGYEDFWTLPFLLEFEFVRTIWTELKSLNGSKDQRQARGRGGRRVR